MSDEAKELLAYILGVISLYLGIAYAIYSFRHPEMTDTQRLLHIKDVLLFN